MLPYRLELQSRIEPRRDARFSRYLLTSHQISFLSARAGLHEGLMNFVDRTVERRCAAGQSDRLHGGKPLWIQCVRSCDMQHWRQLLVTETNKLESVVRVASADDNDSVNASQQREHRVLTKPGRLTDRINKAYVRLRIMKLDARADCAG